MGTALGTGVGCSKKAETVAQAAPAAATQAALLKGLDLEKDELKLGFIKLTDCAPLGQGERVLRGRRPFRRA